MYPTYNSNRVTFVDSEICRINEKQVLPLSNEFGLIPIYRMHMLWHDTDGWCIQLYYLYNGVKYKGRIKILDTIEA